MSSKSTYIPQKLKLTLRGLPTDGLKPFLIERHRQFSPGSSSRRNFRPVLSIVGQLEKRTGERAVCVKREWR